MYLHGSFRNQKGETVTVGIVTRRDRSRVLEIGEAGSGVYFTTDPVEITGEINDTLDPLLTRSAVIRLRTRAFLEDLFCESCMDAVVNIKRGGEVVFAGYVLPQSYSQSFSEVYDDLEINCIDALSALQFSNYRGIGSQGVTWSGVRENASQCSFRDIITGLIAPVTSCLDLSGKDPHDIWYDCSRCLTRGGDPVEVFSKVSVSELLFLGDSEDDVWTRRDVLAEIMRYLNLHIRQEGFCFRIFSWEAVKGPDPLRWRTIDGLSSADTTLRGRVDISADTVSGTDCRISVDDVYNRIELHCETKPMDELIQSPLDESAMTSPFSSRQLYLREYVSPTGKGDFTPWRDFLKLFRGERTSGEAFTRDWYMQVHDSLSWSFRDGTGLDLVRMATGNRNQSDIPNRVSALGGALLMSFGDIRRDARESDNSPVSRIDMTKYLVVAVNGNGKDSGDVYPDESTLLAQSPLAVYTGASSGGVFSPADDDTVNYIVISGKIALDPLVRETCSYEDRPQSEGDVFDNMNRPLLKDVPCKDGNRLYCRQWWKAGTPTSVPVEDPTRYGGRQGLMPYTGDSPREYEFKYSAIGDGSDRISKVAAIACMLVIGDKCVVETGSQGQTSDFEWRAFKEREECGSDDEYYAQCFTIGFDPKIGDRLLGTEFDIQNNISYEMGLDTEGTAIPVRKSDRLFGRVRFMILGPVNTTWGVVTRRHPTWFRHTKWSSDEIPLMPHVGNIYIRNFEVKVYSDNGLVSDPDDSDLVYMSDTREDFINTRDDITFRMDSALTSAERQALGISGGLNLSTPFNNASGTGLLEIYDSMRGEAGKPEQLYVDACYRESHRPRTLLSIGMTDTPDLTGYYHHYLHPALPGREFYVTSISRNLMEGSATLELKEIDND